MKHLGSDIGTCEMHPSLSHLVVQEHYGNHFYTYDPRVASLQVDVTCSTYTLPQNFEAVGYAGPFIYIRNPTIKDLSSYTQIPSHNSHLRLHPSSELHFSLSRHLLSTILAH